MASSVDDLLDKARAIAAERTVASADRYRELVSRTARGEDVDAQVLADTLGESGGGVDRFKADVIAEVELQALKALAAKVPEIRAARDAAAAACNAITAEYSAAIAAANHAYSAKMPAAEAERARLAAELAAAEAAAEKVAPADDDQGDDPDEPAEGAEHVA